MGIWRDTMKQVGGGDFTFLSEDGERLRFIIVAGPVVLKTKFKGVEQTRIGVPCITLDGFALFITGKRVARRLSKHEDSFDRFIFEVTRHGKEDESTTSYTIDALEDPIEYKQLADRVVLSDIPSLVKEAVQDAITSFAS